MRFFQGLLIGLAVSCALWALLLWAVLCALIITFPMVACRDGPDRTFLLGAAKGRIEAHMRHVRKFWVRRLRVVG